MALGYLILFWMILAALALAAALLWLAFRLWVGRRRVLALLPLLPAVLCGYVALWLLAAVLREPFWRFG